ncbi:ornithine cyclodeaminase family protein [Streptomyces avermitilis]|uniref:ornithine cyclodeaminase family protein n=1 Tax=Streptomyces avermitilis TaxID=33903 RepID=UPI0037F688AC
MPNFPIYGPSQLRAAVGIGDLIDPVAEAFAAYSTTTGATAPVSVLPLAHGGDSHIKAAYLPGRPNYVVKIANWFPRNAIHGLPQGGGFVALFDAANGRVKALFEDEHHLSDMRTAAAGAVCARLLARRDATQAVVLGTGRQAHLQAVALTHVRPIQHITVWGRNRNRADNLVDQLRQDLPATTITSADSAENAIRSADIIVTATGSRTPVLFGAWLRPGQHITALGADDATKRELDDACLQHADRVLVDSRDLSLQFGDLHAAVQSSGVTADRIDGEIGEAVAGLIPGRKHTEDVTVAKLIGIGTQDLLAAETALRLLEEKSAGHPEGSIGR